MRKVIVQEWVTLDGLAAGPAGNVDFIADSTRGDRSFGTDQLAFLESIDTILLGRVTYQMFAGYWPGVTEGEEKAFADRLNGTPKFVFTQTLKHAPWGTWKDARIVREGAADEVGKLKRQPGKAIVVWGSISLAQHLIDRGVVDEYRLVMCPVVLGSGRPLFREGAPLDMKLVASKTLDRGAVSLTYVQVHGHSAAQATGTSR